MPNPNGRQGSPPEGGVSQLARSHPIFGRVTAGMHAVEAIPPRDRARNPSAPAGDAIARITIEEVAP